MHLSLHILLFANLLFTDLKKFLHTCKSCNTLGHIL